VGRLRRSLGFCLTLFIVVAGSISPAASDETSWWNHPECRDAEWPGREFVNEDTLDLARNVTREGWPPGLPYGPIVSFDKANFAYRYQRLGYTPYPTPTVKEWAAIYDALDLEARCAKRFKLAVAKKVKETASEDTWRALYWVASIRDEDSSMSAAELAFLLDRQRYERMKAEVLRAHPEKAVIFISAEENAESLDTDAGRRPKLRKRPVARERDVKDWPARFRREWVRLDCKKMPHDDPSEDSVPYWIDKSVRGPWLTKIVRYNAMREYRDDSNNMQDDYSRYYYPELDDAQADAAIDKAIARDHACDELRLDVAMERIKREPPEKTWHMLEWLMYHASGTFSESAAEIAVRLDPERYKSLRDEVLRTLPDRADWFELADKRLQKHK